VLCSCVYAHPELSLLNPDHPVEINDNWSEVLTKDGIRIEYKVQECNNLKVRNQVLVLFRFTNTSSTETKVFNWGVKQFRNGECYNCDRLDTQEFQHSLVLSPGEILEGDGTSTLDQRVFLFSHFINLVPGMSDQKLTDFEFVNVEVNTLVKQ